MNDAQKPATAAPEWLTAPEAAEFLHLTLAAFYQRVYRGQIPTYRLGAGRSLRFRRPELEALLTPSPKP